MPYLSLQMLPTDSSRDKVAHGAILSDNQHDYGKAMFERADFARMATLLAGIQGRFIMSINDVPQIRELFAAFTLTEVSTTYTIGGAGRAGERAELLISNFAIAD